MNEVYPPKIISMAAKCKKVIPEEEIVELEGLILKALDFEMAI
jgi:hypothetical protein